MVSATGLIRLAWREVWQHPRVLTLAFWYLLITSIFEYFVISRLGAALRPWLSQFSPAGIPSFPHLPAPLMVKLILAYLTMILIVSPFALAGLYGGAAASVREGSPLGFLTFFAYAVKNFWRMLALEVSSLVSLVVVVGLLSLVATALAWLGHLAGGVSFIFAIVAVLVAVGMLFTWMGLVLYWFGAAFYGQEPVVSAAGHSIQWVMRHIGFTLRLVLLMVGLLVLSFFVITLFSAIPVLGPLFSLVGSGVVMAILAMLTAVFHRETTRMDLRPPI